MTTHRINYDAIPGNTNLVDIDGHVAARHDRGNSKIVLVPTPSDDPDDPLNWTPRRKWLSVMCMVVYTFGIGVPGSAIYSVLTNIAEDTGITLSQLNAGTGYMFLFFGLGCMLFQPLALQYGKRPVYLFSVLATSLVSVWGAYCKGNSEWIGSKIILGLVGAPIESLCEISVSDVFFEHERATGMGIYGVALLVSNFLAPVIAGFIESGLGWQWVLFLSAIWAAVAFIFLFLFMEETNYDRKINPRALGAVISAGKEKQAQQGTDDDEKMNAVLSHQTVEQRLEDINEDFSSAEVQFGVASTKTWAQKMSLTGGMKSKFLLPHYLLGPLKMAMFPPVLWAGFLYGSSLVWFNLLNATAGLILTGAPYNFSASQVGLAYLSPTILSCLLFFLSGYFSDWLKVNLAKRRPDGLSYPEDRLWSLCSYIVLGFLACIGWGVGAYYEKHWFLLVISMGFLGGAGIFAVISSVTYISDCYHELDTEAMVVAIVIRNLMSFACSHGLTAWVENMGYKNAFITAACLLLFTNATFVVMWLTGGYWREKLKGQYWRLVEENRRVVSATC